MSQTHSSSHRSSNNELATHVLELARIDVDAAMSYLQENVPYLFLRYYDRFLTTFRYIEEQKNNALTAQASDVLKNYHWPTSFSHCTAGLRETINRWLTEEFPRRSQAKCLILIGPSGCGKTTFAKSLPGRYNYFKNRWHIDMWDDTADYLIFDKVVWDEFEEIGFPCKDHLLTQHGPLIVWDKAGQMIEINVKQPSIVLIDQGTAEGSLTIPPRDFDDKQEAKFWKARSIIYRMNSDDHFYRPATGIEPNR